MACRVPNGDPMHARVRVGTSGWEYRHWVGSFYPRGLPRERRLEFYGERFDTVELNSSFYRLPSGDGFATWSRRVPDGFSFSVKASRYLTHVRRLKDPQEPMDRLWRRARRLGDRLGPMLYQLPPRWRPDLDRLIDFLSCVPSDHPQAIEARDSRWYGPRLTSILDDAGLGLCLHDMAGSAPRPERVGPLVYVRFHGSGARYGGRYTSQRLTAWAERMARWTADGWPVWAYFNNDIGGHAVQDADRLRSLLRRRGVA